MNNKMKHEDFLKGEVAEIDEGIMIKETELALLKNKGKQIVSEAVERMNSIVESLDSVDSVMKEFAEYENNVFNEANETLGKLNEGNLSTDTIEKYFEKSIEIVTIQRYAQKFYVENAEEGSNEE